MIQAAMFFPSLLIYKLEEGQFCFTKYRRNSCPCGMLHLKANLQTSFCLSMSYVFFSLEIYISNAYLLVH